MRQSIRCSLLLLIVLACGQGCYSRQLLPAMTICAHDQQDRPVPGLSGTWSGYATEDIVWDQPFAFEPDGCARIARYDLQTNVFSFLGAAMWGLFPHQSGLRPTTTDVRVSLPEGYEVDEAASQLKRTGSAASGGGPVWEGRDDMTFYLYVGLESVIAGADGTRAPAFPGRPKPPDQFVISLKKPGSRPTVDVRLVLRRKPAAAAVTSPTTREPSGRVR